MTNRENDPLAKLVSMVIVTFAIATILYYTYNAISPEHLGFWPAVGVTYLVRFILKEARGDQ